MKRILTIVGICAFFGTIWAQADTDIVNIPDANFKRELVQNRSINTNRDQNITYGEARAYTGDIDVPMKNISSLEGISAFRNIKRLYCPYNQIASLDLSQNTELNTIDCRENQLTSLDVTQNTKLKNLSFNDNQITNIDLSQNQQLRTLGCGGNPLTSLNITQNTALTALNCDNLQLTNLNISQNVNLEYLECRNNQFQVLNISHLVKLLELHCENNKIEHLDISQNPLLEQLNCSDNHLVTLKLANSNNTNIDFMYAGNNPYLTCIQIDDNFTPPSNWEKDVTASYNIDCQNLSIENSISNNEIKVVSPMGELLIISGQIDIQKIEIYNITGQLVKTLEKQNRDISSLSKGVYFLRIFHKKGQKTIKAFK